MERRVKRAFLAMLACALIAFALPAFSDSQARIVRLSYMDGSVQIDRNTGQGFERAIANMPITQGTRISTGDDGEAEVEFENGSSLRLTPGTQLGFDQLSLTSNGDKVTLVNLEGGLAYFDIKRKGDDDFRVVINGHDVQLKKSAHFRAQFEDRQVELAVFNGELEMQGAEGDVKLKKNETVSFNLDEAQKYTLAKGVDNYQYDSWDKERSEYQSRYAYNKQDQVYSPMDASLRYQPYYGWSDLNYYGNFSYIPGFGYGWRPYSVGTDWDPFGQGYWVWYPSMGYTWVSPYPWGWAPYRYGGWRFVPGYGWAWLPGYSNAGWYSSPRIYNAPSNYRFPTPPKTPPNRGNSVVPVGNPVPATPRMQPRWRTADENPSGRPGAKPDIRTGPGSAAGGTGAVPAAAVTPKSGTTTQPEARVENRQKPTGRMDPEMRRGNNETPQRRIETSPRSNDAPRTSPAQRSVDTPRPAAPAPRMSPPPAPQSSAPSMRSPSMSAPSGGASLGGGAAGHSVGAGASHGSSGHNPH